MEMKLTIDISDRLENVLLKIGKALSGWSVDVTPAQAKYFEAPAEEAPVAEPAPTPSSAPAPAAEEKPFNAPLESRRIIDATRKRLLTEDNKEQFSRPLTAAFKNLSASLGAEKPSLIDSREKMEQFEVMCSKIEISGNSLFTPECPF